MELKVFYAWQADISPRVTKNLIRESAIAACESLNHEYCGRITLVLDEAAKGIPGMCDIPNVILEKLDKCAMILADLTFVAESESGKMLSNSNVVFELGYAAKSKGFDRILAVMNTAFGQPEGQMFDVKRRWALPFELKADCDKADLKKCRASLTEEIHDAFKVILDTSVLPLADTTAEERFEKIRTEFESKVFQGKFCEVEKQRGVIAICIVPDTPSDFDYTELQQAWIMPPGPVNTPAKQNFTRSIALYDECYRDAEQTGFVRCDVSEVAVDGTVLAIDTWTLSQRHGFPRTGFMQNLVGRDLIPCSDREILLTKWLAACSMQLQELGIKLPWQVGISLLNIKGYDFLVATRQVSNRPFAEDHLRLPPIRFTTPDQLSSPQSVARELRESFNFIWRSFGFEGSRNYDAAGRWVH